MTPDPRPLPRIRDPGLMRLLHSERTKQCAITEETDGLELHHILPRSSGGDDVRANFAFLRFDVHRRVTNNDPVALRLLGEYVVTQRPDTVAYLKTKLGDRYQDWMRRRLHVTVEDE